MHIFTMRCGVWFVLIGLLTRGFCFAQAGSTPKSVAGEITRQLSSPDPTQRQAALDQIRQLLQAKTGPKSVYDLQRLWLPALILGKHYDDVPDLAQRGILLQLANVPLVESLQQARIRALLALKKNDAALAHAKSLYNIASMASTGDAMAILLDCLKAARPDSPDLLDQFKQEQTAGAAGAATRPADLKTPTPNPASVLASIKVDPQPYEDPIAAASGADFYSLTRRGNLLLLSDDPNSAMGVFELAYTAAQAARDKAQTDAEAKLRQQNVTAAAEAIARCMKAQDGSIGRANAWVASLAAAK